jgi:hypothetical protein
MKIFGYKLNFTTLVIIATLLYKAVTEIKVQLEPHKAPEEPDEPEEGYIPPTGTDAPQNAPRSVLDQIKREQSAAN